LICIKFPSERQIEGLIELDERAERESAELYGASITNYCVFDLPHLTWHALYIPRWDFRA